MQRWLRCSLLFFVLILLLSGPVSADPATSDTKMEVGEVSIGGTINYGVVETVNLDNSYSNPVVVAYLSTRNGGDSVEVRVRNVQGDSFEIFMEEPQDNGHTSETANYIVMEEGTHTLPDGTKLEAGTDSTSNVHNGPGTGFSGDQIYFDQSFTNRPVVLATLNTYNNNNFMSTRISKGGTTCNSLDCRPTSNYFGIEQEAAETGNSGTTETIGWIAVQNVGSGSIDGINFETGISHDGSNDGIDDNPHTFDMSVDSIEIVKGQSGYGGNGYWAWSTGSPESVYATEDRVNDDERSHANNYFGYWSFSTSFSASGSAPKPPSHLEPDDSGRNLGPVLSAKYSHPDGEDGTIRFYNASSDNLIGSCKTADNALCTVNWTSADDACTDYSFYARSYDGTDTSDKSPTTTFTTEGCNQEPTASKPSPEDGGQATDSTVELEAQVTDLEGSNIDVGFYNLTDTDNWRSVVEWNRTDGDNFTDLRKRMERVEEFRHMYQNYEGPDFLRWAASEKKYPGGDADDFGYMKYRKELPPNTGEAELDLHFRGASFEDSGISFWVEDTQGNKHILKCDEGNQSDGFSCSNDHLGAFEWNDTYTVKSDNALETFYIASSLVNVPHKWYDQAQLTAFNLSVDPGNKVGENTGVSSGTRTSTEIDLDSKANYSWYIGIEDSSGEVGWSDIWGFEFKPLGILDVSPSDGSFVKENPVELSMTVNSDSDEVYGYFFNASGDEFIGKDSGSGEEVTLSSDWSSPEVGKTYDWYMKLSDGGDNFTSSTYSFVKAMDTDYRIDTSLDHRYSSILVRKGVERTVFFEVENKISDPKTLTTRLEGLNAEYPDGSTSKTYNLEGEGAERFRVRINGSSTGKQFLQINTENDNISLNTAFSVPVYVKDYPVSEPSEVSGIGTVQILLLLLSVSTLYYLRL